MTAVLMPGSSGRVVVSHAPEDRRLADAVGSAIEERDVRCWLLSRDAPAGSAGAGAQAAALEDATAILALVSAAANSSADLRRQLEAGFSARRPLLALSLDGAQPEGPLRYYLGESRHFVLGDDRESALDELAAALRRYLRVEELPRPAGPLIGRSRELGELVELLHDPSTRLLTLTGPGGTGKTRLALEGARALVPAFEDGPRWISLAPLRDPELALSTLAQALALGEQPERDPLDTLAEALASRELLLVLDNAEHLLPRLSADVADLHARCPRLRILVTSRERLDVRGERSYPVPALAKDDAVALFRARARAVGPELEPSQALDELCRRLDRLPLALELAAARTSLFTPEQLLARLGERLDLLKGPRDADPRQQTLRATIDWSYDLLAEEERRAFRALSVFAGGCTYEAADAVARADPDVLQSLIDKSLLRTSDIQLGRRYWLLETIREYAADAIVLASEAEALQVRHLSFFTAFAEQAHVELRGPNKAEWLECVKADLENARAALGRQSAEMVSRELQLRLAAALRLFWDSVGSVGEGLRWIERGLEHVSAPAAQLRYDAYIGASAFASQRADFEKAFDYDALALAAARELDDRALMATALMRTAIDLRRTGELARAHELYEQALALAEQDGDDHLVGALVHNLGDLALSEGDFERAQSCFQRALAGARARSDPHETAFALCNLALASLKTEQTRASAYLREAMVIIADLSWPFGLVYSLELAGDVLAESDPPGAARLLGAAEAMRLELELPLDPFEQGLHDESVAAVVQALGADRYVEASDAGRAMGENDALGYALDRLGVAELSPNAP